MAKERILNALEQLGIVSPEGVRVALLNAETSRMTPLHQLLVNKKITEDDILRAAKYAGIDHIVISTDIVPEARAVLAIPKETAMQHTVLPVSIKDDTLTVIMRFFSTKNITLQDDLKRLAGVKNIIVLMSSESELQRSIATAYRAEGELRHIAEEQQKYNESLGIKKTVTDQQFTEIVDISPSVKFVNLFLKQAITDRASDIHVEPQEGSVVIRFRIDGVLHDAVEAPKSMANEITSRIKVMADLDIAERRRPQDGRLTIGDMDLRVAVLPTVWGEKIVMRILDNSQSSIELLKLGFSASNLERFESAYKKPHGMILVTGPTGSGKSTTLYAALHNIATPEVNIITVEDPVEYRVPRINQVQVNLKAGLTFPGALRSILRSDPDVILIGEIRDTETARIAVEAAQTGHLVLSTLHTNDAASAVSRLTEMGIEPFLVASVLESVVGQRLIRKLCSSCKVEYPPTEEELEIIEFPFNPDEPLPKIYNAVGCKDCSKTGYKGRTAVHEVLLMTPDMEQIAASRGNSTMIFNQARKDGMITMREAGWAKVLAGDTSIAEILRVVS